MTEVLNQPSSPPDPTGRGLPQVVGADSRVTLADGRDVRVVQLNNAATTPPFERTLAEVREFLGCYGALHRGAGPRARATVEAVERAVGRICAFLGQPADNGLQGIREIGPGHPTNLPVGRHEARLARPF